MPQPSPRSRPLYVLWIVLTMATGLLWRSRFMPLPPPVAKYGGDAWWALLVFFGFGFCFPKTPTSRLALAALGVAWSVECSQLCHAPWIDALRATRIGSLVLGATFNPPDLLAYGVGIAFGAFAELLQRQMDGRRRPRLS